MPNEEPQHWPTERMINEGYPEYATEEDLEGMDGQALWRLAGICEVKEMAPEECIPCLALVKALEIQQAATEEAEQRLNDMAPVSPGEIPEPTTFTAPMNQADVETNARETDQALPGYRHAAMAALTAQAEEVPLQERFAQVVHLLDDMVTTFLEGPPIPPANVSRDELALLVVAAQQWIKITEAQGFQLAAPQQQMLDATKALVSRLHHG